ncbi:hypothetical protein TrVE_jg2190 [Triparma verrucosa]|uniref:Uncharacterized protein n=1 Tax=Triparma verrucosa TaxID=1606542 RepID=A0A9W7KVZ6_9STRA|nr:hypothetical protein TrVE_jg2190 [Triparma verrucosa]
MDTETKERVLARQTIAFQKHLQQGSGAAQKVLNDLQCRNKALQRERPEIQRRLDNPTRKSRKKTVREKNAADRKKLEEVDREFSLTRQQGGGATVTSTLVKVCKKIEKLAQQNPTSTAELNENLSAFSALMTDLQRTISVVPPVGEVLPVAIEELGTLLTAALADIASPKTEVAQHGKRLDAHDTKFDEQDTKLAAHDTKFDEYSALIAELQAQSSQHHKEKTELREEIDAGKVENSRLLDMAINNRGDISTLAFGNSLLRESMTTVVPEFQAATLHSCSPPRSPPFSVSASCSPVIACPGSLPRSVCLGGDRLDLQMDDLQIDTMSVPLTPPECRLRNPLASIVINRNADFAYAAKAPAKHPGMLPNYSFTPNEKYKK